MLIDNPATSVFRTGPASAWPAARRWLRTTYSKVGICRPIIAALTGTSPASLDSAAKSIRFEVPISQVIGLIIASILLREDADDIEELDKFEPGQRNHCLLNADDFIASAGSGVLQPGVDSHANRVFYHELSLPKPLPGSLSTR